MQVLPGKYEIAKRRTRLSVSPAAMLVVVAALAGAPLITACSNKLIKHGHQFRATDAQLVQPGMSQEDVRLSLGTPTTTSRRQNGTAFYYISTTTKQAAFLSEEIVDRRIFAVYFNELGTVDRIANYGLKDGRVFDFINRETPPAANNEDSFLNQMFKNLGKRGSVFGQ